MKPKVQMPLYVWVEERIREDIACGNFREGELIPTEKELARKYEVSPGTVRRAALNLKQKGLLYRVQGRGTSVVFDEYNTLRYRNYRFVDGLNSELKSIIIAFLGFEVIPATGDLAEVLKIGKYARVIKLERMGKIADRYLLHTISYLPQLIHNGLEKYGAEQFLKNTLWKIQEVHFKINIAKREEFLSVIQADKKMAKVLDVELGKSLLRIEALLTSSTNEVIEYRVSHCNLGVFRFYTRQNFMEAV